MNGKYPIAYAILILAWISMPLNAELEAGGLEGSSGLGGASLNAGRLEGGRLENSSLRTSKLQPAKPQHAADRLNPTVIKIKATQLAEGGLGVEKLQGAASTIPRSQVGALLYDVAGVLLAREEDMTAVAIGYYMAVLADPQGERHDDALVRLRDIFLDRELSHEDAVRFYDGGLETMKGLVDINIGLTADGYQAGLRTLQEVKMAYQIRRKREIDADEAEPAAPENAGDRPTILEGYTIPLSGLNREDVGKEEAPEEPEQAQP